MGQVTRRRASRPAGPPGPPVCRCYPKSYIIATFRDQQLVAVTRKHNRPNPDGTPQGCTLPSEQLDPVAWYEGQT